jgi:hypothetical protein
VPRSSHIGAAGGSGDPGRLVGAGEEKDRTTGEPAVLLNTFTPDLYVQYFRDLRDMIAAGQPMTPENASAVMSRYATAPASDFAEETP